MSIDLDKLHDIASSATQPGPWSRNENDRGESTVVDADGMWVAKVGAAAADATFIAACSPDVILSLIAEVRALRGVVEAAELVAPSLSGTNDWACSECRPQSDMLVAGFRCYEHALIDAIDALRAGGDS